jgi:hypothetical protein
MYQQSGITTERNYVITTFYLTLFQCKGICFTDCIEMWESAASIFGRKRRQPRQKTAHLIALNSNHQHTQMVINSSPIWRHQVCLKCSFKFKSPTQAIGDEFFFSTETADLSEI